MNCIEAFIGKHHTLDDTTKKQRREMVVETVRYIYRIISAAEYSRRFNRILGKNTRTIELQRGILRDGYIMKNFKLWFYFVMANGLLRKQRAEIAEQFDMSENDIEILSFAGDLQKDFNKIIRDGYKPLTLERFERNINTQLENSHFRSYVAKFVYRKMRFIVQTQGLEHHDLIQEVTANAVQSVFFYYPKIQSFKHCQNILKRTVVNSGKNLLDFYAGKKRSKLITDDNGNFSSIIVPLSYAVLDEGNTQFLSATFDNTAQDFNETFSIKQILSKYDGKRQRFLHLIMYYDAEFSDWLQANKITRLPNDEFMERCKDVKVYMTHVLDYLGVKHETGMKFVSTLRQKLA